MLRRYRAAATLFVSNQRNYSHPNRSICPGDPSPFMERFSAASLRSQLLGSANFMTPRMCIIVP